MFLMKEFCGRILRCLISLQTLLLAWILAEIWKTMCYLLIQKLKSKMIYLKKNLTPSSKKKKKKPNPDWFNHWPDDYSYFLTERPDFFFFFFFCLFAISRATPVAYGGSQARRRIGAIAAGPHHSHSNAGS